MIRIATTIFLLTVSAAASAGTITYLTQERSVFSYAGPGGYFTYINGVQQPIRPVDPIESTDFGTFDYTFRTENLGCCFVPYAYGQADQHSSLYSDGLGVESVSGASSDDYSQGLGYGLSLFDVTFVLDEATRFDLTGFSRWYESFDPLGVVRENSVLLETLGGEEVELDWQLTNEDFGDFYGETYDLDSRIWLDAGSYHLRVVTEAAMDCGSEELGCMDFGAGVRARADFAMSVVPVPAAVWFFGSALAGLGWMRRKQIA